jgi:hypothetical protein
MRAMAHMTLMPASRLVWRRMLPLTKMQEVASIRWQSRASYRPQTPSPEETKWRPGSRYILRDACIISDRLPYISAPIFCFMTSLTWTGDFKIGKGAIDAIYRGEGAAGV